MRFFSTTISRTLRRSSRFTDLAQNPKFTLAGNVYGVEANAEEGERIVLDQIERKIYRVDSTGTTTNLFDYRIKTSDPFKKISPGDVTVQFSGEFGFDIELLQQRSEPKWI